MGGPTRGDLLSSYKGLRAGKVEGGAEKSPPAPVAGISSVGTPMIPKFSSVRFVRPISSPRPLSPNSAVARGDPGRFSNVTKTEPESPTNGPVATGDRGCLGPPGLEPAKGNSLTEGGGLAIAGSATAVGFRVGGGAATGYSGCREGDRDRVGNSSLVAPQASFSKLRGCNFGDASPSLAPWEYRAWKASSSLPLELPRGARRGGVSLVVADNEGRKLVDPPLSDIWSAFWGPGFRVGLRPSGCG
mmetsp:Transcript_32360/g.69315  ORF Transcript_32360/g.69315 Transcript_32360/m.69315 type:complete len:245 (-) Transcript_32360:574-1308(-)